MSEEDSSPGYLEDIQKAQNKVHRMLNNTRIKDKISTRLILRNLKMMSVNQINAQVKLTEIWKSTHVENYPIQCQKISDKLGSNSTRASSRGDLILKASTHKSQGTFLNDAIKIWNEAPFSIKNSKSLATAKKEIKKFVVTLPV